MEKLLSKWEELAPDECIAQENGDFTITVYGNLNIDPGDIDKWTEWEILGATMQACQSWLCKIFPSEDYGSFSHGVGYGLLEDLEDEDGDPLPDFLGWIGDIRIYPLEGKDIEVFCRHDSNPAIAYLEAYLKALAEVS